MTALAVNTDRKTDGGRIAYMPLEASANPYQGSLMSQDSTGYAHELVAGEPFAGISLKQVPTAEAPDANGGLYTPIITGTFTFRAVVSGLAQTDVYDQSEVWATDDNTLSLSPTAIATLVGKVIGKVGTEAIILAKANGDEATNNPSVITNDTGNLTLTNFHLDKLITISNTAPLTLTLPTAASAKGRRITYTKLTSATGAVTIDGSVSETIDGNATVATVDAKYDCMTIISDGSEWVIESEKLA